MSLKERIKLSYENRNSSTGAKNVRSALDFSKLENKPEFFSTENEKKYKINILPYKVSDTHPLVLTGKLQVGDFDYVLDYWVHRFIGPDNAEVVCLKKTFGGKCPICEKISKLYNEGNAEEAKKLSASRRVLYNVQNITEEPSGVLLFNTSHYLFEKLLVEEYMNRMDENDSQDIDFTDTTEKGCSVRFKAQEEVGGGYKFLKYGAFSFPKREEAIDKDLLSNVYVLNKFLVVKGYEEIEQILNGDTTINEQFEAPVTKEELPTLGDTPVSDTPKCPAGGTFGQFGQYDTCFSGCPDKVNTKCSECI